MKKKDDANIEDVADCNIEPDEAISEKIEPIRGPFKKIGVSNKEIEAKNKKIEYLRLFDVQYDLNKYVELADECFAPRTMGEKIERDQHRKRYARGEELEPWGIYNSRKARGEKSKGSKYKKSDPWKKKKKKKFKDQEIEQKVKISEAEIITKHHDDISYKGRIGLDNLHNDSVQNSDSKILGDSDQSGGGCELI